MRLRPTTSHRLLPFYIAEARALALVPFGHWHNNAPHTALSLGHELSAGHCEPSGQNCTGVLFGFCGHKRLVKTSVIAFKVLVLHECSARSNVGSVGRELFTQQTALCGGGGPGPGSGL